MERVIIDGIVSELYTHKASGNQPPPELESAGGGMDEFAGVEGGVGISFLGFFQKPGLGSFIMKANVHLESPLKDSGWWTENVKSDAKDKTNVRLHRCCQQRSIVSGVDAPFRELGYWMLTRQPYFWYRSS